MVWTLLAYLVSKSLFLAVFLSRGLHNAGFDLHITLLFIGWDLNRTYHFRCCLVIQWSAEYTPNQTQLCITLMLRTYFDVRGAHLIINAPCFYHFLEKKALKIVKIFWDRTDIFAVSTQFLGFC